MLCSLKREVRRWSKPWVWDPSFSGSGSRSSRAPSWFPPPEPSSSRLVRDTLPSGRIRDREELARTFLVWCESPFSPGETARRLHLHRNTLAYRLDRIRRLTGLDPRDFHQAFRLYLALTARRLLGPPASEDPDLRTTP